ncbi:hypothetical protein LPMP_311370, partial [Leishmania panamensis]
GARPEHHHHDGARPEHHDHDHDGARLEQLQPCYNCSPYVPSVTLLRAELRVL